MQNLKSRLVNEKLSNVYLNWYLVGTLHATGSVSIWAPGNERNLSIPCVHTIGCVLRISVHDTATLQSEDIPKLNVERSPLLISIGADNPQKWVKRYTGGVRGGLSGTYLTNLPADEFVAAEHTI